MLLDEVMSRSLVAPVPDNDGGTPDNLTFIALSVQLAKASIFAQLHVIRNSQKWDLMFLTQSLDQFLVGWLIAVLGQDAKQSLSLVKSFGGLMESSGKSILDQGVLEHFMESCFEVHATSEIFSSSTDGGRFRQPSQRSKHWLWQMFLSCSSHRRWQQQWAR